MTRLTIGMPVYNGAATIRQALDSLLLQTARDFVLVISDNCSTDDTSRICAEYVALDTRIQYVRQDNTLPPQHNFKFVLMQAQTEYFMWAAADDFWAPSFAERNLQCLEADASLVMSQSQVLFTVAGVDSHMSTGTYPLLGSVRENAAKFFANPADNSRFYGIFRTAALKAVYPSRSFYAQDWLISAATLRYGKHNEIPETLMTRDSSDIASYERALCNDHRFILWRIFPVLFMTKWLLTHRLLPVNGQLLQRLFWLNVYLHCLFGVYRFKGPSERYLATLSPRYALGFGLPKASVSGPNWKGRVVNFLRPGWRLLPLTILQRKAFKASIVGPEKVYRSAVSGDTDCIPIATPAMPVLPSFEEALHHFRSRPENPELSLIIVGDPASPEAGRALTNAALAAAGETIEVLWSCTESDRSVGGFFKQLPGIVYLKLPVGTALGGQLNAAMAAAQAPHVLILRADAGYNESLVPAVLAGLAQAALVAPQLLGIDGRLIAAGGYLSLEQGAVLRGAGANPASPRYAFAQICDFAADALALRRADLPAGAPFDPAIPQLGLAIADFCLRHRATLGAPLYWPEAVVHVPVEPAVSNPAWIALAKCHGEGLITLWRDPDTQPYRYGAARPLRVLYVDADTPTPDQNAGSILALNLMHCLKGFGFDLSFVPESNFAHRGDYTAALQRMGIEAIYHPHVSTVREVLETSPPFDAVVLCRAYIADRYIAMVRQLAPQAKIIFFTVDLHFLREQREAELSGTAAAKAAAELSKQTELRSIAASDVTVVLSTHELELLRRELPLAQIRLLPLLYDIPATLGTPGPQGRRDIAFVGTYQHPPNADAAVFFTREVWPLIRARLPGARFLVVGSAVTPEVAALASEGVEVLGFVPDLESLFSGLRVAVAPLRYGAGLKGKVASALKSGVPMVATSIAAEGAALRDGEELLIADDPQAIADAVVRLYQDDVLWSGLVERGFAFVRREFSLEANVSRIVSLLSAAGVSTLRSDFAAMQADLQDAHPSFQPSQFWQNLASEHAKQLLPERLATFKRSINNCYMQWLPGSFEDPRMTLPMANFHANPSMVAVEIAAGTPDQPELRQQVVGYGDFRPFENPAYLRFYAFYCGLLWDLMARHASDLLYATIEEPALGAPIRLVHDGRAISQDLAQSLLEHYRIKELSRGLTLPERPTYLELGAGYGRLAYVLLKARRARYIIVDILPALLVSKWYLSSVFPELKTFGYQNFESFASVESDLNSADLIFLSPNQLDMLPDRYIDVAISISSLHEMLPEQVQVYKQAIQKKTAHLVYFKQWKKWTNPVDLIEMDTTQYALAAPWQLVLDCVDLANSEFQEQAWFRPAEICETVIDPASNVDEGARLGSEGGQ